MPETTSIKSLEPLLSACNSIRGALFILKNNVAEFSNCHIAYEFMLRENSYIRSDHVKASTLAHEITDIYMPSGGPNSDPVIETIGSMKKPLFIDIGKLCATTKSVYYKNPFFISLMKLGYPSLAAYPILLDGRDKFGILTVIETPKQQNNRCAPEYYLEAGKAFHQIIKKHGHLARYFAIDDEECFILEKMAGGKTSYDVAHELQVTQRTVERRLQSARKKLKARTTTEAVYKAAAYAIIFT